MKKSLVRLLSFSVLALLAIPLATNTHTVQADDPGYQVGGPVLGSSYANVVGKAVPDNDPNGSASGQSQLGVGFIPGPLTLNQVPIFDFGIHQLGSSSKYALDPVATSAFQPKLFSGTPSGDDTTDGGMRSLVVTDTRLPFKETSGYTVSLKFGYLKKIKTTTTTENGKPVIKPELDADGNFIIDTTAIPINDATLEFGQAQVSDGSLDWNKFLVGSADPDYFNGKPAIYPGFYDASKLKTGGAITTSNNRLKDDPLAPTQTANGLKVEQTDDSDEGYGTVIMQALGKTDTKSGTGYGTWAYDFTNSSSAYLAMPTQNEGFWVATLTWTLTSDPASQPEG